MENWVNIFSTEKLYLAEIAKQVLFDHGIQAVVVNKKDSNYLFGVIEIHVPRENAVKGKNVLKDLDNSDAQNA
jgi:hypothetical protein